MTENQRGNRLDPWLDSYAERAAGLRESEVRSLFSVASRPEVVSLAGGMPNLKDLPMADIAEATKPCSTATVRVCRSWQSRSLK